MRKIIEIFLVVILAISFTSLIYGNITKTYAAEEDITDHFIDENLRAEILNLAKEATGEENKTKIYKSDIDKIVEKPGGSSLRLAGKGIKTLDGIEEFYGKGITWIFLDWNELTDISLLRGFIELEKISFSGNNVSDVEVLGNLPNLKNITAINNKIEDISLLRNLEPQYICLDGNNITNIDVVSNWDDLISMSFSGNSIENIPDLSNLEYLDSVNLSNNKIEKITGGSGVLEELNIDNNNLNSLAGIEQYSNLEILSVSNNQINSLSELETLSNLENLNVNKNQINNVESLSASSNIKYLYMDNNNISSLESLNSLENLIKYSIYNQTISIEIKEKITGKKVEIPLPDLYKQLYDENSSVYHENLQTKILGDLEYEITEGNESIILNAEDLQNGEVSLQVSDENNTYLKYNITLDKTAPKVEGVEDGIIYNQSVTPESSDDDIEKVELLRNGASINYNLGEQIIDAGKYTLTVTDVAGNETKIEFEIIYNNEPDEDPDLEPDEPNKGPDLKPDFEPESDEYKKDGEYIIGVKQNTNLSEFKEILNGNINYDVYRENIRLSETDLVITGDKLITEYGETFYIIVRGDISKDGITNIKDLVKIRRNILSLEQFDELQQKAGNLAEDDVINIKDLVIIRRIILGLET